MSSRFYTNQDKTLTEIINGILPKSNAADILVGYFYFSGYKAVSDGLKDKRVRILVGLDVDTTISKSVCEIERFKKTVQSRGQIKEEFYAQLVNLFNDTNLFDDDAHIEQCQKVLHISRICCSCSTYLISFYIL